MPASKRFFILNFRIFRAINSISRSTAIAVALSIGATSLVAAGLASFIGLQAAHSLHFATYQISEQSISTERQQQLLFRANEHIRELAADANPTKTRIDVDR